MITITPTVSTPPLTITTTPKTSKLLTEPEQKSVRIKDSHSLEELKSSGGIKAEVVEIPKALEDLESLRNYLEHIKKLKAEQNEAIIAEPLVSPSTTISTIFMSGSVPGQFSTSLVTITLAEEQERIKREVQPSLPQPVTLTKIGGESEDVDEIEIFSSFEDGFATRKAGLCSDITKTVTVTVTKAELP